MTDHGTYSGPDGPESGKNAVIMRVAAGQGDIRTVKKHLESGLSPDTAGASGWTALHCAALGDHAEIIELLLQHGADPDAETRNNSTALHLAAFLGHEKSVFTLLKNKASGTVTDRNGGTPLHDATKGGHTAIATVLVRHGADPQAPDSLGHSALDYTQIYNHPDTGEILRLTSLTPQSATQRF